MAYITNRVGNPTQFVVYMPYGESLTEEHNTGNNKSPYKFNGKEQDEETGLYYYGARYYNNEIGLFYGVDPLTEKYPHIGGYVYCSASPIMFIDPDGKEEDLLKETRGLFDLIHLEAEDPDTITLMELLLNRTL